jgi:tRNA threonylcarbamoyladenosine biosynthesis protein TsaE
MTYVPRTELPEFVRNVRAVLKLLPPKRGAVVVFLKGELGAGKTTFVQELAREYGIQEGVKSPTYILMRSFDIPQSGGRTEFGMPRRFKRIVHIDAYRLDTPQEFAVLKPDTFLNEEGVLVLVEWPERAAGMLPKPDMTLQFSSEGCTDGERSIDMRVGRE